MKILHIGLASYFTEGMTYQDNELVKQNCLDGHEVMYISNAYKYQEGKIVETNAEKVQLQCGATLIRLKYVFVINTLITNKIRAVRKLYEIINDFRPDVILSHDLCYYSVNDVIKYVQNNSHVKLYVDTHTAAYNSGTNWLSLNVLHRCFYRLLTKKTLPYIRQYLCVGTAEKKFSKEIYGVPENMMRYWPLGTEIYSDDVNRKNRSMIREKLKIKEEELVFVHSGKLVKEKKTEELLNALYAVKEIAAKMIIVGMIPDDRRDYLLNLMKRDSRVEFLGWKSGEELRKLLCASDLYCQPGTVSATLQNAIGCFSPVMCSNRETYELLDRGNFLWCSTEEDMKSIFERIARNEIDIKAMRQKSKKCALEMLDYKKLVTVLYS